MAEPRAGGGSGSIRVRTTVAAVVVVGVALVAAGAAMVALLRSSLSDDLREAAFSRAQGIAFELEQGGSPLVAGDPEEEFVQVLGPNGAVVTSSPNVRGRDPLVSLITGGVLTLDEVPFATDPFLVIALDAETPRGELLILVGRSLEDVGDATRSVTLSLAFAIPLLLVVVGLVTWWVVGRALAPVERIRAEVDEISSSALDRRVPEPRGDDEIARLASTMNRMLERLEQGQARQRRFVSDASHELRSPVAAIRQHAELALLHPQGTELGGFAEVVLEEDLRIQRVVEDLLLLARIDEGTLTARAEAVDLDDVVFAEAARLRRSAGPRIDTEGVSAGRVTGDPDQLDRLVRNLAENAVRHAAGTVAFALERSDDQVVLRVDDDGPGIPPEERERVFERFLRLDEARGRDAGGSGLGLSIVQEIARMHRGTVEVAESPLGGARLVARFPAT